MMKCALKQMTTGDFTRAKYEFNRILKELPNPLIKDEDKKAFKKANLYIDAVNIMLESKRNSKMRSVIWRINLWYLTLIHFIRCLPSPVP